MKEAAFWMVSDGSLGWRGRCIPAVRGEALKASMVALVLALAGSMLLPEESEAQGGGLTCGWCIMERDLWVGPGVIILGPVEHSFPNGGNECGWDGHDEPGAMCSRCGGTSDCHIEFRTGGCHIACGPAGGDVAAALTEVEDALDRGDVTAVASALLEPRTGLSFDFIPEAGRIDLFLACTPDRAFVTIPVPPEARDRLAAAVPGLSADEVK
ncbi:MAG: hypothetical protein F4Z83_03455 [Gemmatimonadetes bacterium]|nr:hypothetical protein [Gemmatimonadota bacterium]